MKLIGLTGGIGSGKSTVASLFITLGIPVFESDERAKYLMINDPIIRENILMLFGMEAYIPNNELNRAWIASRVFTNEKLLNQLNGIIHPAVYSDLVNWANKDEQLASPYLIQESAILLEENLTDRLHAVILVVANEKARIERVMNRDQVTKEQVLQRMQYQWPDEKKIPLSDYVIYNDGERPLINQVMDINKMIRS